MNEFVLNDMKIAATNGSAVREMWPAGMLTEHQVHRINLQTAFYSQATCVDDYTFAYVSICIQNTRELFDLLWKKKKLWKPGALWNPCLL